nr:hypothetical protein [Tanacetum cinerariifolium]
MNNKKRIVNLEYFREMLQISPRIPNQQFDELPFEEEILAFLRELGHSGEIKVEHKDAKKSNEMYYLRFTKVIVNFFMTKDQSIPKRNKINWHYARDDHMFTTIKLVSRHQNTQQYGVILPVELTNEAIRNSESYKEYYAIASGAEPPKTKASVKKKQSSSDTIVPPPTKGKRLKISTKVDKPAKEKQPAKSSTAKGLTVLSEVPLTESNQIKLATKRSLTQTHISHASGSGADEGTGTYYIYVRESMVNLLLNHHAFVHFLGHSTAIRMLTDVNINKLYQPWRSFAVIINKCLTGKSSGYDSLRISQAQILWGLYHKRNVDYAYLINFKAYKEYYAIATGEAAPKPKASVRRTKSSSDTSITLPTAAASPRLTASVKGKQTAKSLSTLSEVAMTEAQQLKLVTKRTMQQTHMSQPSGSDADEGTGSKPGVPDVPTDESEEELSWNSTDDEDVDEQTKGSENSEGDKTGKSDNDADDQDEAEKVNDDDADEEEITKIGEQEVTEIDEGDDEATESDRESEDEKTREQEDESFDPIPRTPKDNEDDDNNEEDQVFRFEDRVKSLKDNFSNIPGIVNQYMHQQMPEAVREEDQGLRISKEERLNKEEEADELYRDIDINQGRGLQLSQDMEDSYVTLTLRIIKEQVKGQVKEQVSRILPRIEQSMNAQLGTEVLTRLSHSSRTSYAVAADLSEMELKKILIEKMEGNKSIQRSDEQKNLYKALVEAYKADKIILDTYGETVTLKRRRDDESDKDEGPFAGSDWGSKRRREGKEPESASAPLQTATRSADRSTTGSISRQVSASESAFVEEPVQTTCQMDEPSYLVFETGAEFMQTNQFAEAISLILGIVDKYIDHRMNESMKVAVRLQSDRLQDEAQEENEDFLNKLDENIQKIIKEQVKEQVKVQVSKILPKNEKIVNEQLEAEVLTRSSNSSKIYYAVAADLSGIELKKILIEKMESNKSIHRSDEQKNLYKALVDAHECDKLILNTYGDTVTLKRRRDDEDKDEEPSAGSN